MITKTLADLTGATGQAVDEHLALDLEIPVSAGLQAQGDLLVLPFGELGGAVPVRAGATWVEVPPDGVELLRAQLGGNTHTLVADPGSCLWSTDVDDPTGLALGVVDALAPVYLLHPEHGGTGLAPGRYLVRRQREQALSGPVRPATAIAHRRVPRALETPRADRVRFVCD